MDLLYCFEISHSDFPWMDGWMDLPGSFTAASAVYLILCSLITFCLLVKTKKPFRLSKQEKLHVALVTMAA